MTLPQRAPPAARSVKIAGQGGFERWYFRPTVGGDAMHVDVSGPLRCNNSEVLLQAALAGQGIGFFPSWLVNPECFQQGALRSLLADWYGGAALAHAMASGLTAERVALLAPPTNYGYFARRAIARAGLPPELADAWLGSLKQVIDHDADDIDLGSQVGALRMPGMLVYSDDDKTVSPEALDAVAAAWPDAVARRFTGLGHQGVLSDAAALAEMVRFGVDVR